MSKTIRYSHTNVTQHYQIVADHHEVLGSYATVKLAQEAFLKLLPGEWSIDNSPWGVVNIVAPGETDEGDMTEPEFQDYAQNEVIFPD
jgi:hypothetical protein